MKIANILSAALVTLLISPNAFAGSDNGASFLKKSAAVSNAAHAGTGRKAEDFGISAGLDFVNGWSFGLDLDFRALPGSGSLNLSQRIDSDLNSTLYASIGYDNIINAVQEGQQNAILGVAVGSGNTATITQQGVGNTVQFSQTGTGNNVVVSQIAW
ncbi:curlin repeat-containing protein [Salipiger sp. H15]|uniref:Curlin repeat-containing protein n=1 Tax=Alloyangia sp. H15 TaxID=3029062 RepID=A0AAU8AND3_9RHOB